MSRFAAIVSSVHRELTRRRRIAQAVVLARYSDRARRIREERAWLLGAFVGGRYGDNSAALHRFLLQERRGTRVYWVINRGSQDEERAQENGPILYSDDVWTYVYGLLAQVHAFSHGLHDVPSCYSKQAKALRVRLGHGITAAKRTKGSLLMTVDAMTKLVDLVPVSSAFERDIKISWGFDAEKVVVTGIPRFDELLRKDRGSVNDKKTILYMPTWRPWALSTSSRKGISVAGSIRALLSSNALEAVLSKHDATMAVVLHPIYGTGFEKLLFDSQRVSVLPRGVDIQDWIVRCQVLLTDYSSTMWDALYIDRPLVYYHFDQDEFVQKRGSYVDLSKLPGPKCETPSQVIAALDRVLTIGGVTPEWEKVYDNWKATLFPYHDGRNSERVTLEIEKRLAGTRGTRVFPLGRETMKQSDC